MPPLACYAPGLAALLHYKLADAPADLRAGLAVTAVERPVGIAYAELAGFRPAVGLYSSILPLLAYAIFGTSRQLIVGPDSAPCALVAASVAPLAAGDQAAYASLSVTLAFLTGLLCIAASFLRLGALAPRLSPPWGFSIEALRDEGKPTRPRKESTKNFEQPKLCEMTFRSKSESQPLGLRSLQTLHASHSRTFFSTAYPI